MMRLTIDRLAKLVGEEKAAELVREFGGQRVPRAEHLRRLRRNAMLRAVVDEGATYREAATVVGVSIRLAKKVCGVAA